MSRNIDVLIVDDDANLCRAVDLLLEDLNLQTATASNGRDALEKALALRPRLVLTDLMMPIMRGDDLIVALRSRAETSNIVCIMMTSAPAAARVRADEVIAKPFDLSQLEATILRHLNPHEPIQFRQPGGGTLS